MVVFIGLLIALASIAPGREDTVIPLVSAVQGAVRNSILMLLAAIAFYSACIATFRSFLAPGPILLAYLILIFYAALKYLYYGFFVEGVSYFFVGFVHLFFFGVFLTFRSKSLRFDLRAGVDSIACANIVLLAVNLPMSLYPFSYTFYGRFFGVAFNPNVLAHGLALTAICLPALLLEKDGVWRRLMVFTLLSVSSYLVYLTGSRGGIILVSFAILVNVTFVFGLRILLVCLGLILPFTVFLVEKLLYSAAFTETFVNREDTRSYVLERQLSRFEGNPIWGGAWEQARIVYGENLYAGAASELGVVGIFFLLLLFLPRLYASYSLGWGGSAWLGSHRKSAQIAFFFLIGVAISGFVEAMPLGIIGVIIFSLLALDAAITNTEHLIRRERKVGPSVNASSAFMPKWSRGT